MTSIPLPVIEPNTLSPEEIAALQRDIRRLAAERNAVIIAHNYQRPEVQDVADFVGDSLGLSRQAAKTDADVIVFCGVHFMAETSKLLSPSPVFGSARASDIDPTIVTSSPSRIQTVPRPITTNQ